LNTALASPRKLAKVRVKIQRQATVAKNIAAKVGDE
jgi:hypothetical protein